MKTYDEYRLDEKQIYADTDVDFRSDYDILDYNQKIFDLMNSRALYRAAAESGSLNELKAAMHAWKKFDKSILQ